MGDGTERDEGVWDEGQKCASSAFCISQLFRVISRAAVDVPLPAALDDDGGVR